MDVVKRLSDISPRKRLYIMVASAIMLTVLTYYPAASPEVAGASSLAIAQSNGTVSSNDSALPVMPTGYQPNQEATRDPFSLPPQLQPATSSPYSNNTPNVSSQPPAKASNVKAISANLRLTGIAGANGTRVAVIQTDNKSNAYKLNEVVVDYKIIEITDTSVTLAGPGGKRTLQLEAANYKGGTKNAQ